MLDLDVLALDRTLRRAEEDAHRWRGSLAVGEATDNDPFVFTRPVLGQTQLERVRELPETDPLRAPLVRWIHRLAEQRINRGALVRCVELRRVERHPVDSPSRGEWTLSEMLARALSLPAQREAWLAALVERALPLADAEAVLWERREEVAARLGLGGSDALELAAEPATAVLPALWRTCAELRAGAPTRDLSSWLGRSLAQDATEGWPARLHARALAELLRDTPWVDRVPLELPSLPTALAPASFVRGLVAVGGAYARALAPPRQPFVVARDPHSLPEHFHGALAGMIALSPAFVRRRLALGPARVRDHLRGLGAMLLGHAVTLGLALEARAAARRGRRSFGPALEELGVRALGFPLPASLAGVLFRPRADGATRLCALLLAARRATELVELHDEDWFWDPRAGEALRAEASAVPTTTLAVADLEAGLVALGRWIAGALEP